uniref:Elongator complex protein 4 n=1 Tax=Chrysemys picta bellii TaxID=8478 RepID=A0A8C3HCD7_CHRPI
MAALATGGATPSDGATSFQRKVPASSRLAAIAGTRPSVRHGQLLLSSGLPSLDCVLGGGLAVGTLLLIEEDKYGIYSNLLFKYFLAEGIVCGHNLFVASAKEDPADILKELPAPLFDDVHKNQVDEKETAIKSKQESQESMKIAWRYQNLPKMENKAIMERVTNLSDTVVGLESFIGSERETNPLYKDYQGLIHVHQIPRLNSLICDVSGTKDLAFRLKRKQFTIEMLSSQPTIVKENQTKSFWHEPSRNKAENMKGLMTSRI